MRAPWLLALALLLPLAAAGADIKTTLLTDGVDADPDDGICDVDLVTPNPEPGTGQCTLRAAIQVANATPGADRILLRSGDLEYQLTFAGPGEDAAATGDLDITSEIEIVGKGYLHTRIEGKKLKDRIFDVKPGGKLTLTGVSVTNGKTAKTDFDPGSTPASGGCIRSEGELHLDNIFFFRCAAAGNGGALSVLAGSADLSNIIFHTPKAKGEGGAIAVAAEGEATVSRATAGLGRAGTGGFAAARGPLELRQVTVVDSPGKLGGAVAALGGAAIEIHGSTIAENGKVNLDASGGSITIGNSIVWGAKTADCVGSVASDGGNLEGETSCGFASENDQQSQDPLLGRLQFNLGSVPTMALGEGSPAIDHAVDPPDFCADLDARGLLRSDVPNLGVGIVDSGAFEFNGSPSAFSIGSSPVLTAKVGQAYSYDVEATSPGRAPCRTFSLSTSPAGMTIAPDTGLISWTPEAGQLGANDVTVVLTESSGAMETQDFTVNVTTP